MSGLRKNYERIKYHIFMFFVVAKNNKNIFIGTDF